MQTISVNSAPRELPDPKTARACTAESESHWVDRVALCPRRSPVVKEVEAKCEPMTVSECVCVAPSSCALLAELDGAHLRRQRVSEHTV